jgi:hypothetical protein
MKTRITLVNPRTLPVLISIRHSCPGHWVSRCGAPAESFEVNVIDCQAQKISHQQFREEIAKYKPDIVGVTSTTLTYKSALKIAKTAKSLPHCITAIGGPHVTFWDDKALQEASSLDIVIRGEGEQTMLELAQRVENHQGFNDLVGTTCRKDGEIVKNPDRPFLENLDSLPFPALHLWEKLGEIRKYGTIPYPVMTSRGCVYWCNFCTAVRMFGRKYRMRSPKCRRRNRISSQNYRANNSHSTTMPLLWINRTAGNCDKSTAEDSKSNGTAKPAWTWLAKNSSSKCVKQGA